MGRFGGMGNSGECQGICQFGGCLPESSIVKSENWTISGGGDGGTG